jgi:hypothetical protein
MTKKLEEVFNLPSMQLPEIEVDDIEEVQGYTTDEMMQLMARADKIDAALPQVAGLDKMDADYDEYARKSIEAFDDLIELGKNVEDRHSAEIFNAASSMMTNALNAKTNKAQKKLEVIKLQIQKAKLEHEHEKLDYLKKRHLKGDDSGDHEETEGHIIATRNDMLNEIIAGMKKGNDS